MKLSQICIAVLSLFALASCSKWPPNEKEFVEHFAENRSGIEALEIKLGESGYEGVSRSFAGTVLGRWYEGEPNGVQTSREEVPSDDEEWSSLFDQVGIDSIQSRNGNGVLLPAGTYVRGREYESYASYVHGSDVQDSMHECRKEYESAACGRCRVRLDADWWLVYGWWPTDLGEAEFEAWAENKIADDEYYAQWEQLLTRCFIDGGTLEGIPESRW